MSEKQMQINTQPITGFVELLPEEQLLFEQMKSTIENSYRLFGFVPIDTPTIERLEVLLAKVGGETEKQIYRIQRDNSEQALRFDLTVPLARYVAEHYADLNFPFRRYHIAKVFRGERPQKGRFREFFQADIDIIGDNELALTHDAEVVAVISHTFKSLGFSNFVIHINNRKILNGFLASIGKQETSVEALRIIDKLEKIGVAEVKSELSQLGFDAAAIDKFITLVSQQGDSKTVFQTLNSISVDNELFTVGVKELQEVIDMLQVLDVAPENYVVDLSIARGLDYYTGTVYETFLRDCPSMGSVCSGGRYDNLAEFYTTRKLPGVGISIGITRLFAQLLALGVFKTGRATPAEILVIPMADNVRYATQIASTIRGLGIATQVYLDQAKTKKKFTFASKQKFDFVIIVGEDEEKEQTFSLKNFSTGEQTTYPLAKLKTVIQNSISNVRENM
ncbi:MAG: histidine--tRNA ligase [Deltaproteobacteria bacterium]|jgi:histidyl-tRNA synthetase|nr:histidine--tRNA ligase [Deltaproteobacteria bacterium]